MLFIVPMLLVSQLCFLTSAL